VFKVRREGVHGVLRIPPPGAPADRDRGILREWRILSALDGSEVPHSKPLGVCQDSSVLGRPFYLMGYVDGWSLSHTEGFPQPFKDDPEALAGVAFAMVEGVAQLGGLDWQARGLDGLGRPDGFHQRQVERWSAFLDRVRGRVLPGFDTAAAWLAEHQPLDFVPGLMHGDYGFANTMFGPEPPARLAAIIDWEMGTIGDPKLDLAWALHSWPTLASPATDGHLAGMPAREHLLAHYAQLSGRQVDDFDYYLVLAKWKLGVVLEQGYQRAGDDVKLQAFGPMVLELMRDAAEIAESSDYRG
jgi:aminoglycoside phosphotransferase (APT) family kinase protein